MKRGLTSSERMAPSTAAAAAAATSVNVGSSIYVESVRTGARDTYTRRSGTSSAHVDTGASMLGPGPGLDEEREEWVEPRF